MGVALIFPGPLPAGRTRTGATAHGGTGRAQGRRAPFFTATAARRRGREVQRRRQLPRAATQAIRDRQFVRIAWRWAAGG